MSEPRQAAIRIFLVDDHTLFREGLRRLLESEPEFEVCGDFATAEEALEAVRQGLEFDAALIDYDLGGSGPNATGPNSGSGSTLLAQLRELRPAARVLMVTAGMEPAVLLKTIEDSRAGIFLKSEPTSELLLAIRRTAGGEQWISSRAALSLLAARRPQVEDAPARRDEITPRELSVLRGIVEGHSNKEIAAHLQITESLVKAVLQRLFERAGVRSRSQLVRYAIEAQIDFETR